MVAFSGPLPAPFLLEQYENVVPGAAERVIQMAEKMSDHEMECGRIALDAAVADTKRGQWLGAAVVIVVLACVMIALFTGHEDLAKRLGGWTVVILAAVFVLGRLPGWLKSFGQPSE